VVKQLRVNGKTNSLFVCLVVDGWSWFVLREKYCWLVADGWFVLREKYCWLVANKPSEQGGIRGKMCVIAATANQLVYVLGASYKEEEMASHY
jgi:hypothetical protein